MTRAEDIADRNYCDIHFQCWIHGNALTGNFQYVAPALEDDAKWYDIHDPNLFVHIHRSILFDWEMWDQFVPHGITKFWSVVMTMTIIVVVVL